MSGTSLPLESLETVFQQDLNGDGVIGPTKTLIQTDGSTSLTEIANQFFLDNSSGVGPALQQNGAPVVAGQFGAWAPIGAEATTGGYDVAWKNPGLGLYTYWTTDNSGNHLTDSAPMSGTSLALESLETTFNQDLNGDGVIGLTVSSGAILNIGTANAAPVTFVNDSGTTGKLLLTDIKDFTGTIVGFTGNGTLAGSDQIDLSGLNYNSVHFSDSYSNHILTVSDGTNTVNLDFAGVYSPGNFSFASDGQGGTTVYDPPVVSALSDNETFVFKPGLGHDSIPNIQPIDAHDTFVFGPSAGRAATEQNNAPIIDNHHTAFLRAVGAEQAQTSSQLPTDGHVTQAVFDSHENAHSLNLHFIDLHASHFIIG
jgi:hypothetical protein